MLLISNNTLFVSILSPPAKNPTETLVVSTTTSDFHLSKEESGLLIMQDESNNSQELQNIQLKSDWGWKLWLFHSWLICQLFQRLTD